jgi:hypothetical protein
MQFGNIRKLLNGGARAAGVKGLQAEIEKLEAQASEIKRDLATIPVRRAAVNLEDDPVRSRADLKALEESHYETLEIIADRQTRLRAKLVEIRDAEKHDRIKLFNSAIFDAKEKLEIAIKAAIAANEHAQAAFDGAMVEFGQDAHRLFPNVRYAGFVTSDGLEYWRQNLRTMTQPPRQAAPIIPMVSSTNRNVRPSSSFQHAVRLGEEAAQPPKKLPRVQIRETAREGEILVSVVRAGYESPSGKQCTAGDIVAMSAENAKTAVRNSAVSYLENDGASA